MNICTTCGYIGKTTTQTKGSIGIEIFLWLFFIVPGLIYSLWRLSSKQQVCPTCKNSTMIPTGTPKGQELMVTAKKNHPEMVQQVEQKVESTARAKRTTTIVLLVFIALIAFIILIFTLKLI